MNKCQSYPGESPRLPHWNRRKVFGEMALYQMSDICWKPERSQMPPWYSVRKAGACLQVPVFSPSMICLVWEWFFFILCTGTSLHIKGEALNFSHILLTGLVKRSTACHVPTLKQKVNPRSLFICMQPHPDSWLNICRWFILFFF